MGIAGKKELCSGCRLCEEVCPVGCISLEKDREGFLYPGTGEACINCGLCERKCPVLAPPLKYLADEGYMAFSNDKSLRLKASSGGIFGEIAKWVIQNGGVVFGAEFDQNLKLVWAAATNGDELEGFYKSKYIQCDMKGFYNEVKVRLEENRPVLVSGTPCDIAALRNYLGKDYDNLILLDFVCHGVPSQDFFDKCMAYYKDFFGKKVLKYSFRAKQKRASTPKIFEIEYTKNGKTKKKTDLYMKDPFYFAFQKRISLRPSCYECEFAETKRVSDITMGDFHTIEKYRGDINRMDGVSMVLLNTEKGKDVFSKIKGGLSIQRFDVGVLADNNECLKGAAKRPTGRDEFFDILEKDGIGALIKRKLKPNRVALVYYSLPKFVRKILKKFVLGE